MRIKKGIKLVAFIVFLLIALLSYYTDSNPHCRGFASCISGKVDRVIDGDTLVIANTTVRLALVNTPERFEVSGKDAVNFTSTLCPVGSNALVDEDDAQTKGSYGRIVAVVYCNGKNLNEELLNARLGYVFVEFCSRSEFKNENWAKSHGCG